MLQILQAYTYLSCFQDSFAHHSQQQAALAQNLVGKMKQLQEANINMAACDQNEPLQQSCGSYLGQQMDAMSLVQDLSTQLLKLVGSYTTFHELHDKNMSW